ncbi:MAG: protein of unknown function UPF0118 [uncultured bacterium (gcode 4)]|uniref:Permease n=1 Tax=uncultured bacterium (gcode 4) TaxID=1234023 RepID=K2G038_9BACT|nr:MAG: protein of unknown function UPF0118 [uncultured bacterium (gcode 4)]
MLFKKIWFMTQEDSAFLRKLIILTAFSIILFFVYSVSEVLKILFFALFLNVLFSPFLNLMNRIKIRDWAWIIIIYLLVILFLIVVFFAIIPIFIKQLNFLFIQIWDSVNNLKSAFEAEWLEWLWIPTYLQWPLESIDFSTILNSIKDNAKDISVYVSDNLKNFLSSWAWVIFSFTAAILQFLLVFIFAFFIALERREVRNFFYRILPEKASKYILSREKTIINTLSNWFRWQVILGISMFFATLIWLLVIRLFWIRINEFFSLALISWMMEFIPYIWPFIAFLPALALSTAFWLKWVVIITILYLVLQQTENNLLVPYIMSRTLSLSPFAVLLWMVTWASLLWVIWIILAIPVVSVIQILLDDYFKNKKAVKWINSPEA